MSCHPCSVPEVEAEHESLPSALDNFISAFFGSVTKTVVNGRVTWTLPCDLETGIEGFEREEGEGLACYFKRIIPEINNLEAGAGIDITDQVISISSVPYAKLPVGTAANTVAAGNDARIVGALQRASNLADLTDTAAAQVNIGLAAANNVTFHSVAAQSMTVQNAPVTAFDVVNKTYVDNISVGLSPQTPVRVASTANLTLSGAQTIDGVAAIAGNRVLVKNQSLPANNGIYVVAAGAWSRATDADTAIELAVGKYYLATEGTTQGGSGYTIVTAPTSLGADPVVFTIFSQNTNYTQGSGISIVSGVISLGSVPYANLPIGAISGTVAAGNDSRIVGALQRASNLSDLSDIPTAQNNIGLGPTSSPTFNGLTVGINYNFASGVFTLTNANIVSSGQRVSLTSTATDFTYLQLSNSSAGGHDWRVYSRGSAASPGTLDLYDQTAGASRLSIASTGVVTIGQLALTTGLPVTSGGTGTTSTALGDLLYGSGTNSIGRLFGNTTTTTKALLQTGNGSVSAAPAWTAVPTSVAGTANEISASAATGAVTLSLPTALTFTGKTVTGGTFTGSSLTSVQALGIGTSNGGGYSIDIIKAGASVRLFDSGVSGGTLIFDSAVAAIAGRQGIAASGKLNLNAEGVDIGELTATGLNNTAIGVSTPKTGAFTTASATTANISGVTTSGSFTHSSNANLRTTKGNFNVVVNVKDYGATGNGSTDDRNAIQSAISALVSHSILYFPPGKYRLASQLADIASLAYVTVTGDGAEIYNDTGASGANTLVFGNSCSNIEVCGLSFTGSSTVRGSGVHLRMKCNNSSVHHSSFSGCSDFAVLVSADNGTGWINNVRVSDNFFGASLGDGVHVGSAVNVVVADNLFVSTGDDCVGIIADWTSFPPNRVSVTGNNMYDVGGSGISGVGVRVGEGTDISIVGNSVYGAKECGIQVGRWASTSAYNYRILIASNKLIYTNSLTGMLASIVVEFAQSISVEGNRVEGPIAGGGISFLDVSNLVIQNNVIENVPNRGIHADDGTTTNVASNWNRVTIAGNTVTNCGISGTGGTEAVYITPAIGKTISNVVVAGNTATNTPAGNYIFTNRIATAAKIVNNVSLDGRSIANGGSGIAPTNANNN